MVVLGSGGDWWEMDVADEMWWWEAVVRGSGEMFRRNVVVRA